MMVNHIDPVASVRRALCVLILLASGSAPAAAAVPGCEAAAPYTPGRAPTIAMADPPAEVTVIVMHGKNGSPLSSFLQTLYGELIASGYNVIAPQMSWSYLWDGTQCQGLNYLDALVNSEHNAGRKVVVMGHSFGGTHSLIYGALAGKKIEAVVSIAAGHMLPLAKGVITESAASVALAKDLVAQGKGDVTTDFTTLNTGGAQVIHTTPHIFLSFHDVEQFPDMTQVLPQVSQPVLWPVGDADPIKTFYETSGVYGMLPTTPENRYVVMAGDHFSVVPQVGPDFDAWFRSWYVAKPLPRQRPADVSVDYLLLF